MSSPEDILETYEVGPGIYAAIYKSGGLLRYRAVEPRLTADEEATLKRLKEALSDFLPGEEPKRDEGYLSRAVKEAARRFRVEVPESAWDKIFYYLKRDLLGYGKIDPLLRDPLIEDVHLDGPGVPVYVWHTKWESLPTDVTLDREEVERLVQRVASFAGRHISYAQPILEAMSPEGFRVEIVYPPVSAAPAFTIRKYFMSPITLVDMIKMGTASPELVAYLWLMLDYGRNIVIVGPTGAGKTTLLNALLYLIRPTAKIITIEDTREINIVHEHWQALVTRPSFDPSVRAVTAFDLLQVAMRSRPDYVIVGEIRGEEAYVLFQAFASGHSGATTIHADTVEDAVRRLLSRPMSVPPVLLSLAHIFVRILRVRRGGNVVRRIVEVYENLGGESPQLRLVFKWDPQSDAISRVAPSALLEAVSKSFFVELQELEEDLKAREEAISLMHKHGLSSPVAVARVASAYYLNREEALKRLREGKLP
ncbi:MAG: type II/IV secretion system ATPase subunit [Thermoproteus sp. AZ2]|uniref:Type II/IV secretion system ATPase subunit n=1 Tax=Thermoproteus sp. AZ2 TaxID=1609232 RepID=A0ACC6UXZ6_9CREN